MSAKLPLHVLIVEDQLEMRKIVLTILQTMDFERTTEARDGREAIQLLRRAADPADTNMPPVDLIIADWMMPRVSGVKLLQTIRADADIGPMPFMMLTSRNDSEAVQEAIENGVDDYIVKPFTISLFTTKLEALLKKYFPEHTIGAKPSS